jgi:2-keto-4-pentenoate hydratase/2-oxohepta-3-ene-1,7-dioic acid hydratase in catechol pathway
MRLVTYRGSPEAAARLGLVEGDFVVDIERLGRNGNVTLPSSMLGLIEAGPVALRVMEDLLKRSESRPIDGTTPVANVKFLAPIPRPRKNIFGIGLNYVEHVEESSRTLDTSKDLPEKPVLFSKPPTTVIGPGEPVQHNKAITQQLDWEVELAVIIGRTCRRVSEREALEHVFGYSVLIDISARDCRRAGQWIYSKGQDSYAPFGPCIVTADEIGEPHTLDLWLSVNGVMKQKSNTRHMLFKIPQLIADISAGITLEPGDVIATGTPSGVGAGRKPQEWLWPGDVIEAEVQHIGRLRHPVVAV